MNRCVLRVLSAVVSLVLLSSCGTYERLQGELELAQRTNQQLIDQYNRLQQHTDARRSAVAISAEDIAGVEGAEVENGGLRLDAESLFDPGRASLKAVRIPVLDEVAAMLKGRYPGQNIIVEVHTDDEPLEEERGAYQYSIQLGLERATNVFKYLNLKHGIPEERVAIFSSGPGKPPNAEKAGSLQGAGKNRRVVFRLSAHSY